MVTEYALRSFRPPVKPQIDYEHELNEQQHAAVTAPPGPSLVIAGAGSGKTRTLTYRVAFLLEQEIPPERILLLTFTNKAAREMMQRIRALLGIELSRLWGGTFHSIGHRILRRHADHLGYHRDFTILDRDDSKELLNAAINELGEKKKETGFPKTDLIMSLFSFAANSRQSVSKTIDQDYAKLEDFTALLEEVHRRYQERKRANSAMDFDDLLALWWQLFNDCPDVCEEYQRRFQFLLVDEYQDTNRLQSDLIDLLAARHHNVMAVGDDSQSIYGWRGANFKNILEFPKRFPETTVHKIETNYRSTPQILSLANSVIANNRDQFHKELTTLREAGAHPAFVTCQDPNEQARFVAQRVMELRDEGMPLGEMAVLYRSHFHALEVQLELTRQQIPFTITSGLRFFEQAHIKDVAAYLRLLTNPHDEVSFKRIALKLPGIGEKGAARLWNQLRDALPTRDTQASSASAVSEALAQVRKSVPKKAEESWSNLIDTFQQMEDPELRGQPGKLIQIVQNAGYEDYLEATYQNYRSRLDDLEQLADYSLQFETTEDFLAQLALLTNVEAEHTRTSDQAQDQLRLSTIHQGKGLEFTAVFLLTLCEGLFPSARSLERPQNEEEERRLFYVAVTRAKDQLYLLYPETRLSRQYGGSAYQLPSRFLTELPPDLYEPWELRHGFGFA